MLNTIWYYTSIHSGHVGVGHVNTEDGLGHGVEVGGGVAVTIKSRMIILCDCRGRSHLHITTLTNKVLMRGMAN